MESTSLLNEYSTPTFYPLPSGVPTPLLGLRLGRLKNQTTGRSGPTGVGRGHTGNWGGVYRPSCTGPVATGVVKQQTRRRQLPLTSAKVNNLEKTCTTT